MAEPERFVVDDVAEDVAAALASVKETEAAPVEAVAEKPAAEATEKSAREPHAKDEGRNTDGTFRGKEPEPKSEERADPATGKIKLGDDPAKPTELKIDAKPAEAKAPEQPPQTDAGPPAGYSVKTKADWEKLKAAFPHVAADITKRNAEYNNGLSGLQEFKDLKPFSERARSQGQTLSQALTAYVGIDDLFRQDASRGFTHVAQNLGLSQAQAGELFLRLATQLGATQSPRPDQNGAADTGQPHQNGFDPNALQSAISQVMQPLVQRFQTLEQHTAQQSQREQSLRLSESGRAVEQFRADPKHRYYDDVEPIVANLLQTGIVPRTGNHMADLAKAYEQACMLHPEVRETVINNRISQTEAARMASQNAATEKAKNASRSVTGSPSSGAATRKPTGRAEGVSYDDDLTADVTAAVRRASAA